MANDVRIQLDGTIDSLDILANGIMREMDSPKVVIDLPSVYVQHPDEPKVERYMVPEHTRLILEALDRGEPITVGIQLHLMAPAGGVE